MKQLSIRSFFGSKREPQSSLTISSSDSEDLNEKKRVKPFTFPERKTASPPPAPTPQPNRISNYQTSKPVPAFKWIPKSGFVVDAFSYGVINGAQAYFLTHFHSDHYRGLTGKLAKSLPKGVMIYCSSVTANLVQSELRVPAECIKRLTIGGEMQEIDKDWLVAAVDANHCPGSVMLVFWNRTQNIWHLHVGDFRYYSGMLNQAKITLESKEFSVAELSFDSVFLDTTYARPDYAFPNQDEVIAACSAGCQKIIEGSGRAKLAPLRWLICVGSYLIGKERIVLALAEFFDLKIYADTRKRAILNELEWPQLASRLTSDPKETPLHIVSMALLSKTKLSDYRQQFGTKYTHVLGIRPTGWSFKSAESTGEEPSLEPPKDALNVTKMRDDAHIWAIPYSEHSSYAELGAFLRAIRSEKIVPTVDNWRSQVHDFSRCSYNSDLLLKMISKK